MYLCLQRDTNLSHAFVGHCVFYLSIAVRQSEVKKKKIRKVKSNLFNNSKSFSPQFLATGDLVPIVRHCFLEKATVEQKYPYTSPGR